MPIPDFQTLMLPVLRLSKEGDVKVSEAADRIAGEFALTDEEREELLPSGRQAKFANRIHWSVTYLVKSGLLERPRRGYFAITPKGEAVLSDPPERIDIAYLTRFESFERFRARAADDAPAAAAPAEALAAGTPEERVESAFEDLNAALREELLDRILPMRPTAFEKLIVDLMLGMGYGANGSGERLGRTSDGGIDGVINEDVRWTNAARRRASSSPPATLPPTQGNIRSAARNG